MQVLHVVIFHLQMVSSPCSFRIQGISLCLVLSFKFMAYLAHGFNLIWSVNFICLSKRGDSNYYPKSLVVFMNQSIILHARFFMMGSIKDRDNVLKAS